MTKPARLSFCLLSLTLEVLRVEGLMKLFAYRHYGLAAVLAFVGVKLLPGKLQVVKGRSGNPESSVIHDETVAHTKPSLAHALRACENLPCDGTRLPHPM